MPLYDEEMRLLKKWRKKDARVHREFAEWRRRWRVKGPVEFAHKILKVDPESGGPLTLSDDQMEFLLDLSKRGVRLVVLVAGRGAGKTFVIAVYVIWRIFTHEYWGMSCMGGSAEQSAKIHKYITYWANNCPELMEYWVKCTTKEIKTYSNSYASFLSCSGTAARGPHCYSDDTEILTENGWKLFKDLKRGEKVATKNKIGFLEWKIPYEVVDEEYSGKMAIITHQSIDLSVTPNHRLWARKQHKNNYEFLLPNQLTKTTRMNAVAKWKGKEEDFFILPEYAPNYHPYNPPLKIPMNLWLEFFGYYITEGDTDQNCRKVKIRQSKNKNPIIWTKIKNNLDHIGFSYTPYNDKFIIYSAQLGNYLIQFGKSSEKYIPTELKDLSSKQLKILFKSMMDGDGTKDNYQYTTISPKLRDDIIEIALKTGISSSYCQRPSIPSFEGKYISKSYWVITFHKRKERILMRTPKYIDYNGRVYCVVVSNHIIMVRRNGKMVWSGNTKELIIDEEAAGERAGKTEHIEASLFQVSTSSDIHIIKSCYDEETEILTENGWKPFSEVAYDDKIATRDSDGFLEWENPINIIEDYYEGKMYFLHTSQVNQMVTPNHRMFIKRKNWKGEWIPYHLKKAEEIAGKAWYAYKKNAKWKGESPEYLDINGLKIRTEDWVDFFGFWIAEGWTNYNPPYGYITGIRNDNTKILLDLKDKLKRNNIHSFIPKHAPDTLRITNKKLFEYLRQFGKAHQKYISRKTKRLNSHLLYRLLVYYLKGDGHNGITKLTATTSSWKLRDDLQEIALKIGWSANYYPVTDLNRSRFIGNREIIPRHQSWVISFIRKRNEPTVHQTKNFDEWVSYSGKIHCVEVPNHVIYIRRNGKPVWSGNSTAHYVHGDFLRTLNNAEQLGYKKYQWSIARHISGEDPRKYYQDHNPNNWFSNVPWIPDLNIQILRKDRSNDKWLVEALGGVSIASGLVFNPNDIDSCVCSRCLDEGGECKPYKEGHCPIVQYYMQLEGLPPSKISHSTALALQRVGMRVEGVDWGKVSPCAYDAMGKFKSIVFVLAHKERVGQSDRDKISTAVEMANKWNIEIIRPDPREWAYNNELDDKGFIIHELFSDKGPDDKGEYIFTAKKHIERHQVVIPCAFKDLIRSLKNLTWDETGKIRKNDDHSFDAFLYAISYYGEMADQSAFWKAVQHKPSGVIQDEKLKEKIAEQKKENKEKSGDPDIEIIEDWEAWIRKNRWEKEEGEGGDEGFPWGEGVDMWK